MYTIIRKLSLSFVAVVAMAGARAQSSAPAMPEAVVNLNRFTGEWQANISTEMGDKSYQFDYTVKCIPVAGGNGYYWERSGTHPELGEMKGSDLFGYDRTDGKLHCYSVDNTGEARDLTCQWKSPDHLVMIYNGKENGKQISEQMDMTLTGDDQMEFSMKSSEDGKIKGSGSGTFHKITDK
jgi:hypothetical protein